MQTLTRLIADSDLRRRIFSDRQVAGVVEGSAQRRYNLVNRALKAGELKRLSRGLYMLAPSVSGVQPHSFVLAQALRPGSYISFESALAWHGCIPEAVRQVRSVVPGRRKAEFNVPDYGQFRFFPLAVTPGYLLAGVERHELAAGIGLVATPLRALLDLCCHLKIDIDGLVGFLEGLRLDQEWRASVTARDVDRFKEVYRFQKMRDVVEKLAEEVAG